MKHKTVKRKVLNRPHQIVAKEVFFAINDIFDKGVYLDKAIEKMMRKNKVWGVRDREYASTMTTEMVRNWRLLSNASAVDYDFTILNFWTIFGTLVLLRGDDLSEFRSLQGFPEKDITNRLKKFKNNRKIRESYPDWIDKICEKEIGRKWDDIAAALNRPAKMILRANRLKTTREELKKMLEEDGVETQEVDIAPDALELVFRRNVFRYDAFTNGLFEVQDSASQLVSDFLDAEPGMRVVDACAGTGGKSLHLAAFMKNKGKLIALDNKDFKLAELRKRASRAGVGIIETKVIDNTKVIKRLAGSADRVLLDMPCSGLGVLRRNPDTKWLFLEEELERVKEQQQQILTQYSNMCKPGGLIVYAVCSILPSEGEDQVRKFLSTHPDYELIGEKRYSPADYNCDGFYMAKLKRNAAAVVEKGEE